MKALIKYLFLIKILYVVSKNSSKFSFKTVFRIQFSRKFCCLVLATDSIFFNIRDIRDKEALKYIQYPSENAIKLLIILKKILCFYIKRPQRIISCCFKFIISKGNRLLV